MKVDIKSWVIGGLIIASLGFYVMQHRSVEKQPAPINPGSTARMQAGPYIEKQKNISDTETLEQIILPGQDRDLDIRCIAYINRELKQTNFICPGADQATLDLMDQ